MDAVLTDSYAASPVPNYVECCAAVPQIRRADA